jgi:hypothetical protein
LSLEAAADSYVHLWPAELQTVNYGGVSYLKISSGIGGTPEESSVAYVMFDLSELPPGARVRSAILYAYQLGFSGDLPPDGAGLAVRYVDDIDWTEYGITGLKAPPMRLGEPTAQAKIPAGQYTFDVTSDVTRSLEHEKLALSEGFEFTFVPMPGQAIMMLASREDEVMDHRPRLVVRYTSVDELNEVPLRQGGATVLVVITTSKEVEVSAVIPLKEYFIELREGREHGWAKIIIEKSALFANPSVSPVRARFYEHPTQYILVVDYGKSPALVKHGIYVESYSVGTFDSEGRPKRIFDLGEEVYFKGTGSPYLERGHTVDIYMLPDGAAPTPAMALTKATAKVDEADNIPLTMISKVNTPGTCDLWVDVNRNGIFDDNDILNDGHPEAYPMIAVPEFNVVPPLLMALLFLAAFCCRARFIKNEKPANL